MDFGEGFFCAATGGSIGVEEKLGKARIKTDAVQVPFPRVWQHDIMNGPKSNQQ
jgi:hypothetical protein